MSSWSLQGQHWRQHHCESKISIFELIFMPTYGSWSLVFFCFLRRISTSLWIVIHFPNCKDDNGICVPPLWTTFTRCFTLLISLSVHEQKITFTIYSNHKNAISLLLFLKFPPFVYIDAFPVRHTDSLFPSGRRNFKAERLCWGHRAKKMPSTVASRQQLARRTGAL